MEEDRNGKLPWLAPSVVPPGFDARPVAPLGSIVDGTA